MANLKGKDGSFLVLFKDSSKKEIFLIFRTDYPIWSVTGGGIEPGETPKKAATRETIEETGFKFKITRKIGIYKYFYKNTYLFEGQYLSGKYKPEFSENIGKWFPVNQIPIDITSATRRKIVDATTSQDQPFVVKIKNELSFISNVGLIFRHPFAFFTFIKKNFHATN